MPDNPFSNPAFSAMGGQFVQLWQKSLESWWSSLLGDSGRLGELARRLSEVGYGPRAQSEAGAEDLARLVEALELMDQRIHRLEEQVGELTEGLASVVDYLEKQSGGPVAPEEGSAADGGEPDHGGH